MLGNQSVTNKKPQDLVGPKSLGPNQTANVQSNFTAMLKDSKFRHDKGIELYKSGKVSIGSNGLFKVSGYYEADTGRTSEIRGCED